MLYMDAPLFMCATLENIIPWSFHISYVDLIVRKVMDFIILNNFDFNTSNFCNLYLRLNFN
jgi:hypothetical protein